MPPIISIISKKRSGKTTLLEKLIPELKSRGYRVGTVKHDTHGFDVDHEGKDTWRHKQAGAEGVVIACPWKLSVIKDLEAELSLDDIVSTQLADMDIVLTEGYKRAGKPQVEVFRSSVHQEPLHSMEDTGTLIALMTDTPCDWGIPEFHIDDIISLADLVEKKFL